MTSAPNVFDIARHAGVSKSTAARALSGEGAVSPLARQKVLAAADALKYRANAVARNLRRGDNRVLGVVASSASPKGFLSHSISAQKLEGIALGAKRLGYDLQIFIEDLNDRDALRRLAADRFVRGLFFFGPVAAPVLEHLNEYHIPWVGLNWRHKNMPQAPYVWTDFAQAGADLVGHLLDSGCRKILAIDWLSPTYGPYDEGMWQAVYDRNLPMAVLEVIQGAEFYEAGPMMQLLRAAFGSATPPDGIVAGSWPGAVAVYKFLRETQPQLQIGRDIAVATFDDLDQTAAFEPGLTALAQNMSGIGQAAIELMDQLIQGGGVEHGPEWKVSGELRIRASSEGFRRRS